MAALQSTTAARGGGLTRGTWKVRWQKLSGSPQLEYWSDAVMEWWLTLHEWSRTTVQEYCVSSRRMI